MEDQSVSVGRGMAKGAAWMVGMRLAIRGLGMASMIILARLLVPEDFGLVALATLLSGLLEVTSNFSFDTALIRDQTAGRKHYDTAWTLSVLRGITVAIVLVALASPAAQFFEDPRVEALVYCLALASFFGGFQNIGVVDFRKHLKFHKEFVLFTIQKLVSVVVGVTLAYFWRDYWALIAGIMAGKGALVVSSYIMHPYRPRFGLSEWREIFHFTKWLLANNILTYVYSRTDTLFIGKLLGAQSLGIYSLAYEISNLVTSELISPIRRAIFPGFAKLAVDREKLTASVLDTLSLIALIGTPLAAGIGLVADPLVPILLGEKWLETIPLIEILAVYGLFHTMSTTTGPAYLALGKPQYLTVLALVGAALTVPLLLYGIDRAGAVGAAVGITVATGILLVLNYLVVMRLMNLSFKRLLGAVWRTVAAVTVMAAAVLAVKSQWPAEQGIAGMVLELATLVLCGALVYCGTQLALWHLSGRPDGAERHVLTEVQRVMA